MFKIIKSKEFELSDNTKGVNYTVAYKGRVMQFSSLNFSDKEYSVNDNLLKVNIEVELRKKPYINNVGEQVVGLEIMPKLDLSLSEV